MTQVHIVDYGVGNLLSVARAITKAGGEPVLASDRRTIENASHLLLPGVGAFEPCIRMLEACDLVDPVMSFAKSGRPFLGICVGMQLLFNHSLEFGRHAGLGLIGGHVAPIPTVDATGQRKVPHIGWATLLAPAPHGTWQGTLLEDLESSRSAAYFVHSFSCIPDDDSERLADVDYGGFRICAAARRDNITATQFHPEKSGDVGLRVLGRFIDAG